jgi:hypothetical protein
MLARNLLLCIVSIIFLGYIYGQKPQKENSYGIIVQIDPKASFQSVLASNQIKGYNYECISHTLHIYKIWSDIPTNDLESVRTTLTNDGRVLHTMEDRQVTYRRKPNDPRFIEQYALDVIKAFDGWDISTGGVNALGEDVVIALIDDGFDLKHEDLSENIYKNPNEVPDDKIDNDGNGFVDDVSGWNFRTNKNAHDVQSHGTFTLGVIGATGNNNVGISGINWKTKIMPITVGTSVSSLLSAFDYIYRLRKMYNDSNGKKGVNIVVTSYSAGINYAFAADNKIWCDYYDKLGLEGILSVVSTTNNADNVDVVGDMPSTCTSSYLIAVTSSNELDELDDVTGFGPVSVDLCAPGEQILTTDLTSKSKYKQESGTSLSTPIVSGTVGLLYTFPCKNFVDNSKADPGDVALKVRKAILNGTDPKNSMKGLTVTGGRLNIFNAFVKLKEEFTDCDVVIDKPTKGKIENISYISGNTVSFSYEWPNPGIATFRLVDASGKIMYEVEAEAKFRGSYTFTDVNILPGVYYINIQGNKQKASEAFYAF